MRQYRNAGASLGVACALLTSTWIVADEPKTIPPPIDAAVVIKEFQRKQADAPPVAKKAAAVKDKVAPAGQAKKAAEKKKEKGVGMDLGGLIQQLVGVARPAPPAAAVVFNANVNLNPLIQQNIQQFRPILRSEYALLKIVCDPPPEKRKLLAQEGEKVLKDAAAKYSNYQQGGRNIGNGGAQIPNPRKLIQEGLARAVKQQLSAEQLSLYEREIEKRRQQLRQVAVQNVVAHLDQDLILSEEQREKLGASLSKNWNDSWVQSLEVLQNLESYFPNIPNPFVVPILNARQKKVWDGIQKNQYGGFFFWMEDDPNEDEDLAEARKVDVEKPEAKKTAVKAEAKKK